MGRSKKKQCDFAKTKAQNKRKYERGNEKKTKTCKWLIRKIEQIGKNYGPTKQGWFIKKTCRKSTDSEEKVAAKVCSCACKFYKKKENKYKKKNCKKSTDPEEKVAAKVCSCACRKY